VQGTSPKEMAPNLFKEVRFKRRSISYEMQNLNWVRNIQNINSTVLLQEFVMLYVALQQVGLNENRDEIVWRWSANRKLSVSSVYECQFYGALSLFPTTKIWKAKSEPRSRFFAWLAMHDKVLTADNMEKKNWSCNHLCSLCFCQPETTSHILTKCNYTESIWQSLAADYGLPNYLQMS
jgi:hypothetical protein